MNATLLQAWFAQPHAWLGTLALLSFWVAALARKGSRPHRYAGRVFLLAMAAVVLTAVPLTLASWLRGHVVTATFLAYLIVLVTVNGLNAWRAIRWRADFAAYANRGFRWGAWILGLTGTAVVVFGLVRMVPILIGFGLVGPILAWQSLRMARRGPTHSLWWLRSHYGAMLGNGAATHIAFLQIGLSRFLSELGLPVILNIAWFGPLLVATVAGVLLDRRYRRVGKAPVAQGSVASGA